MFDVAVFTDVVADEAVDGRSGFNFESISPGFTASDQGVARDLMLHRADAGGNDAAVSVESYCHRAAGGRFYFSRGRDLGLTASGRGGNQLTEIVVTGDPDDLGSDNPAQLYGARAWRLEKRGNRVAEQWPALPDIDSEFGVLELVDWARADAARWRFLPDLVTGLEARVTGQSDLPVVLVHDDLRTVMRWLALGYQLLNVDAVRSMSFRGFESDPARVGTDIVACRPEHAAAFAAMTVLDLGSLVPSGRTPSFAVQRSMELLDTVDTFSALDVITTARRWDPYAGQMLAFWGAELVLDTLPDNMDVPSGLSVAALVEALAEAGLVDDLSEHWEALGSALAAAGSRDPDQVLRLTRVARRVLESPAGNAELAEMLVDLSLVGVQRQPSLVGEWARILASVPGGPWAGTRLRGQWAGKLTDLASACHERDLLPLFLLADSLRPELPDADWQRPADRLARHLADHPDGLAQADQLWNASRLRGAMTRELVARLEAELDHAHGLLDTAGDFGRLRNGEFSLLAENPGQPDASDDARFLVAWEAAARLSLLESKRRMQQLPQLGPRLSAPLWRAALVDSSPRSDGSLWVAWLREVGSTTELLDHIETLVRNDLAEPATRELKDWRTVLDALATGSDGRTVRRFAELRDELDARYEQRDTAAKRIGRWMPSLRRDDDEADA